MKLFAAFVLLVAGVSAMPQEERFTPVTDQIIAAIEDLIETIQENGLDPFLIKRESGAVALPVPVIFNAAGFCEDIVSTGLSNIVIKHMHYDVVNFRLTFELEMPHVHFSAGTAAGQAEIFGNKLEGNGYGSIDVIGLNAKGVVRVSVLGGIAARSVELDMDLERLVSDLTLNIEGYELGGYLNTFFNDIVPRYLDDFKNELDELIAHYVLIYINENILN